MVSVRGRAAVELEPLERTQGGVAIRGRIYERGSGEPIAFAVITLVVDGEESEWVADAEGRFERLYPLSDGSHDVAVEFSGDSQYSGTTQELAGVDVSKRPLELSLEAPGPLDAAADRVEVVLRARSAGEPAPVRARLFAGPATGELREAGTISADDTGRGVAQVPRDLLGAPGRVRFAARFSGDDTYDPAAADTEAVLRAETALAFSLSDPIVAFEGELSGSGRLTDSLGTPLSGQPVALEVGGSEVARAATDADGTFQLSVDAADLGAGPLPVQAVFEPPEPWLGPSRSPPLVATVGERRPIPVATTLTAFAATAVAMLAFVALRTRPWVGWMARLRPAPRPAAPGAAREELHTGLAPARAPLTAGLRRPADRGFSGLVRAATSARPVPGAAVALTLGPERREGNTDAAGRFSFDDLEDGSWVATVSAPGFCTERFPVEIPHRGELRDAAVDLMPVKERIFSMYREAAAPHLPRPGLWGIWTPRQIVDHVRAGQPAPELAALTDYVEEAYFSPRTPGEEALELARDRVEAARREASDAASGA